MSDKNIKCPECGSEITTNKTEGKTAETKEKGNIRKRKPFLFPSLFEMLVFLIFSGFLCYKLNALTPEITKSLKSSIHYSLYSSNQIDNADTIFQQVYYLISNTEVQTKYVLAWMAIIFWILIILLVLLSIFSIWSIFKYNRIERRIVETQELIYKHFDIMNEGFNNFENKNNNQSAKINS